ncbi:MAG: hypothetical protein IPG91_12655 [Ideonella sp.]|nr:hypothetical protein [Ideonella sp.]
MTTVYRKSTKGQHEIETRANRLGPRLRTALILVDGRRTDADLRALIQLEADATLLALLEGGYIEVVASMAPPAAAPVPPHMSLPVAPAAPAAGASPAASAAALADRRRLAVRHLTDNLGPVAEELALRIEKTRTWAELRPVLELGRSVLQTARGGAAAARFAAQFIDPPLA